MEKILLVGMFLFFVGLLWVRIDKNNSRRNVSKEREQATEEHERRPQPKYNELSIYWQQKLKKIGMDMTLEELEFVYSRHLSQKKNYIPFEIFFKRKEYHYLLNLLKPKVKYTNENDGYRGWGVHIDGLRTAMYVQNLFRYLNTIQESKELLGNIEQKHQWSKEALQKWVLLEKEEKETSDKILSLIYKKNLGEKHFLITFSKLGHVSEEERLRLIDENLEANKPSVPELHIQKRIVEDNLHFSSPALIELKEFIDNQELNEEVKNELRVTIQTIQEKLQAEEETDKQENLSMKAFALNEAAKKYHKI